MKHLIQSFKRYGFLQFFNFAISELHARLWRYPVLHSYSQDGEDMALDELLNHKKRGFYVDIGAYDPYRFSNTMRFYKRGWKGINIEPDPERFRLFENFRTRDMNVNAGIGRKMGKLDYFAIDPPTLSTFSALQAKEYTAQGFTLRKKQKIQVMSLEALFRKYAKGKAIDFVSLDVEGFEMEVLGSNNWKQFRPHFFCIETAADGGRTWQTLAIKRTIGRFMDKQGYVAVFDNGLNTIYQRFDKP